MKKTDSKRFYNLLILSAVFLTNPNINIIDIMPDFVAWFILAKLFERAADSAPYFEEARSSFLKLAWINLAKVPAFFLMITIRSKDTLDNNVFALFSLSFCAIELVFLLPAIKNLFTALFHLGERTSANSLITPIQSPFSKGRTISPDSLKECTYFFFICKGILNFIPDMFMLTSFNDRGTPIAISKNYPYVFAVSIIFSIAVAVIWFNRIKKYATAVYEENKFSEALDFMAREGSAFYAKRKTELRTTLLALTLLGTSALFTLEFSFDNLNGINVLPHFIYGILLIVTLRIFDKNTKIAFSTYICGVIYVVAAIISYTFSVLFLSNHVYLDILDDKAAQSAYLNVEISGMLEFVFLAIFLIAIYREIRKFIYTRTGILPTNEKYGKIDEDYHKSLNNKNMILCALGILAGAAKCVNLFFNSDVQILFTSGNAITTSSVPWFNLLVQATAIAYILFAFYLASVLKDEVKEKYAS